MRLRIDLHLPGHAVQPVLAPNNMSLTQVQEILDEEWVKYQKVKTLKTTFADWLIGNTDWRFEHWATGSGRWRWNASGTQYKEEESLPVSVSERFNRAIEHLQAAQLDLINLADPLVGIQNNSEDARVMGIIVNFAQLVVTHVRGVQRRIGERS